MGDRSMGGPGRAAAKLVALLAVAGLILLPVVGEADHVFPVPDGKDCAGSAAPGPGPVTDPGEQDRGAVCLSDGDAANGAEHYVGGEGVAESDYPDSPEDDTGSQCGAVIVGGQVQSQTRPDDPATPENEGADWDWMHPHDPDGVPGTGGRVQPPPHVRLTIGSVTNGGGFRGPPPLFIPAHPCKSFAAARTSSIDTPA